MELNLFYNLRTQNRDSSIFDLADNGAEQAEVGGRRLCSSHLLLYITTPELSGLKQSPFYC